MTTGGELRGRIVGVTARGSWVDVLWGGAARSARFAATDAAKWVFLTCPCGLGSEPTAPKASCDNPQCVGGVHRSLSSVPFGETPVYREEPCPSGLGSEPSASRDDRVDTGALRMLADHLDNPQGFMVARPNDGSAVRSAADEIDRLESENRRLRGVGLAVVSAWREQAGRVFEAMGDDNPRAGSIDEAIGKLDAALSPSSERTPRGMEVERG